MIKYLILEKNKLKYIFLLLTKIKKSYIKKKFKYI